MSWDAIIVVPGHPPSGNHYAKHTRGGGHYITAEAKAWYKAVAMIAMLERIPTPIVGDFYEVDYVVYLGAKRKGDVANFEKCIGDALVKCKVLKSDDWISDYHQHKRRDHANPRVEIRIRGWKKEPQIFH